MLSLLPPGSATEVLHEISRPLATTARPRAIRGSGGAALLVRAPRSRLRPHGQQQLRRLDHLLQAGLGLGSGLGLGFGLGLGLGLRLGRRQPRLG